MNVVKERLIAACKNPIEFVEDDQGEEEPSYQDYIQLVLGVDALKTTNGGGVEGAVQE